MFDVVKHPLFGVIVGIVATSEIRRGEEIYCDYNYDLESGPYWYREGFERREREFGVNNLI